MPARPPVAHGSWIKIGDLDCVVCAVRSEGDPRGDCEVVFNSASPIYADARWTGHSWSFVTTGDLGGDASKLERLQDYVYALKRGRQ